MDAGVADRYVGVTSGSGWRPADTGAYASAGPGIMVRAFISLVGPYQIPNVAVHGRVAYTNNTTAGAMRGYGAVQPTFAVESAMDELARTLDMDPLDRKSVV